MTGRRCPGTGTRITYRSAMTAETHRDPAAKSGISRGLRRGADRTREHNLDALARAGIARLRGGGALVLSAATQAHARPEISPAETAQLYQSTEIVVNVFREIHHFNREKIAATAPNPRVLEALACGALVVSERRAGIGEILPELPQFTSSTELVKLCNAVSAMKRIEPSSSASPVPASRGTPIAIGSQP